MGGLSQGPREPFPGPIFFPEHKQQEQIVFTVKFYSKDEVFIREAENVQVRKVDREDLQEVIIAGIGYLVGKGESYHRAIVENASGKTTQIVDDRH